MSRTMEQQLIIMTLVILIHVEVDTIQIQRGIQIHHPLELLFFILILCFSSLIGWRMGTHPVDLLRSWVLIPPIRWFLFDLWLNIRRGLPHDYLSSSETNPSQAFSDRFLRWIESRIPMNQFMVKWAFLLFAYIVSESLKI